MEGLHKGVGGIPADLLYPGGGRLQLLLPGRVGLTGGLGQGCVLQVDAVFPDAPADFHHTLIEVPLAYILRLGLVQALQNSGAFVVVAPVTDGQELRIVGDEMGARVGDVVAGIHIAGVEQHVGLGHLVAPLGSQGLVPPIGNMDLLQLLLVLRGDLPGIKFTSLKGVELRLQPVGVGLDTEVVAANPASLPAQQTLPLHKKDGEGLVHFRHGKVAPPDLGLGLCGLEVLGEDAGSLKLQVGAAGVQCHT